MKGVKDIGFYQKVIEKNNTSIDRTETFFKDFKEELTNAGLISRFATFTMRLNILIASYSKGDSINELKKQFSEAVYVMEKVWDKRITKVYHGRKQEEYNQYKLGPHIYMLQMLSLAVLLNVPKKEFKTLESLIDVDCIKDYLFEFLLTSFNKDRKPIDKENYQRYLIIPKLYKKLVNIVNCENKNEAEEKINEFLKKDWIKIPKKHFINLNLKDIKDYEVKSGFVGLWAFEVAAVVKIKQLDDSNFRDNRFYPNRLLNVNKTEFNTNHNTV